MLTWLFGLMGEYAAAERLRVENLVGTVRDDLIEVHVVGGSGAGLEDVDLVLVTEPARHELLQRLQDRLRQLRVELPEIGVRLSGRVLHAGDRPPKGGRRRDSLIWKFARALVVNDP
jgi:hypothetical protein